MCGVAGALQLHPSERGLPLTVAEAMVRQLGHRGPDGCGVLEDPHAGVLLGHTRLAIIDLSAAGRQPMASLDGRLTITYNGEIYNYQQLRDELSDDGCPWRSRSDTEVILGAYARWGQDCVHHLRGMFAFAIWDAKRQELFLARDRLGIKPLYYYSADGAFVFASEVRALLASDLIPRRLDQAGLWHYLAYQCVPAPRTLVDGVRALPPGTCLRVDANGGLTLWRYWDLLADTSAEAAAHSPAERRQHVAELLGQSIRLHLVSDVPIGVFLSGGIDSSAIVGLMREAGQVPYTFSLGFAERSFDETHFAREVAQHFNAKHTEIRLRNRDLLEQLPEGLAAMDQPTGDGINSYIVARAVRSAGLKVALSGLGGDELFGGYPSFDRLGRSARLFHHWARLPAPLRALAASGVRISGRNAIAAEKLATMLESDGRLSALYPVTRQVFSAAQRQFLLGYRDVADPYVQLLREAFAKVPQTEPLACVAYAESRTYLHDLLLRDTDQMSMAHGLEVRVPLIDHELAAYVMGVPDSDRRADGTPKRLLVECLGGLLPEAVVRRPKQGFTLPLEPWMRGPLAGFCEQRLRRLGDRGLFRPRTVDHLWQSFLARGRDVSWSRLWTLVALDEWLERSGVRE